MSICPWLSGWKDKTVGQLLPSMLKVISSKTTEIKVKTITQPNTQASHPVLLIKTCGKIVSYFLITFKVKSGWLGKLFYF